MLNIIKFYLTDILKINENLTAKILKNINLEEINTSEQLSYKIKAMGYNNQTSKINENLNNF